MIDPAKRSHLTVTLFGTATVRQRSVPIHLSPQQAALVALVYGHGQGGVSRPRAAWVLWHSDPDAKARHRLRQLLVAIRSRTKGSLIVRDGDLLKPVQDVLCDLHDFEQYIRDGMLAKAASLLADGFAELPLTAHAVGYDDWRSTRQVSLADTLRTKSSIRFDEATRAGKWDIAWDAAEALYAIDKQDPGAVLRIIEVRGHAGRVAAAEAAFADYLESLPSTEEPAREVVETLQRVREMSRIGSSTSERMEKDIPLVGRNEAMLTGRKVLDLVKSGRFGFALITGEPGIGKTRVLQELYRESVLLGFRCLKVKAIELESRLPLTPLLDALSSVDLSPHLKALGHPWDAVIGALLPAGELGGAVEELPPIQESALTRRLLDAFRMLLTRLAEQAPTLLFLDDLQWADPTSVTVLQFVQRRWTGGPLGVIATIRVDPTTGFNPDNDTLSPRSVAWTHRIPLGDLTVDEACDLVEIITAGQISDDAKRRICELAGLHPLFLTELTRDYIAGQLRLPALPADEVTIPVSLKQILDARLEQLGTRAAKLAGMLAVAGRPLSLGDAAELTEMTLDRAADAVEELVRARLISMKRGRLRISHELFRSAIYRHIGEPRRAVNHRILACHLLAANSEASEGELATHYARAGESELAAKHGWSAARKARETGALTEAAHFYQLVVEHEADAVKRAHASAELAYALHLARDIGRANPLLEVAATRLRAVGRSDEALRAEIKRVEGLAELGEAPIRDLWPMLDTIKREARDSQDWEALALAVDAELHLLHRDGDVQGIRMLFAEMREVSRRGSSEASLLAHAGIALGVLYDDPEEALQAALEAVAMTSDTQAYHLTAMLRLLLVLHYRGMLSLPAFSSVIDKTRSLAARSGDVLMRFSVENNLAVAELDAGNLERAEAQMRLCAELSAAADMDLNRAIHANNRAELALARRDYETAAQDYADAATFFGLTTPTYMQDLVNAGLGYCALERGNLSEARRREQEIHDPPRSWYFDPTTILAFRARLLERRGRHEEAVTLLDANATSLEGRLVLAWLKVRRAQVRLMLRRQIDVAEANRIAVRSALVAEDLRLVIRAREFSTLAAEALP